jgi:predicted nucleic acid-binding protein
MAMLLPKEEVLCFSQNLVEFWNVATRPADANGLGFSAHRADRYLDGILSLVTMLPDTSDIFPVWRDLVVRHRVSGRQAHDARIVAAMKVHGVDRILTFDLSDFNRYDGITVVHPESI